jgi:hypothetical protein
VPVVDVGAVGALLHDPPLVALAVLGHGGAEWRRRGLGFGRARLRLDLRVVCGAGAGAGRMTGEEESFFSRRRLLLDASVVAWNTLEVQGQRGKVSGKFLPPLRCRERPNGNIRSFSFFFETKFS